MIAGMSKKPRVEHQHGQGATAEGERVSRAEEERDTVTGAM